MIVYNSRPKLYNYTGSIDLTYNILSLIFILYKSIQGSFFYTFTSGLWLWVGLQGLNWRQGAFPLD